VHRPQLRDYLRVRGYEVLDATALAGFLTARLRDRVPSVVVFAMNHLPLTVAPSSSDTVLFRRYLDAGGKVLWHGLPPLIAPLTAKSLIDLDRQAVEQLIGVSFSRGNFDATGVTRITEEGQRLGLPDWWLDNWGANPEDVTTVLAYDELGQAAAWIKSFGGPAGSGFVRFFAGDGSAGRPQLFTTVQALAELRPR
jgi:hypothetical protein